MSDILIGVIVFGLVFGAAILGTFSEGMCEFSSKRLTRAMLTKSTAGFEGLQIWLNCTALVRHVVRQRSVGQHAWDAVDILIATDDQKTARRL